MEHLHPQCGDVPVAVEIARYRGQSGVQEIHLMARPREYASFEVQLDWIQRACRAALDALRIDSHSAVLRRFFCSDISNQARLLGARAFSSPGDSSDPCAASWVGQPPPGPAKVALWAYHLSDPGGAVDKHHEGNTLTLERGSLQHHWTSGVNSPGRNAFEQTKDVFATYETFLHAHNLTLADNVIRTWLFVRDIDADYRELAEARREYFAQRGLTPQTHYIASTGIEGAGVDPAARVSLDAYAISGVQPEQLEYIKALDHLGPTDAYRVTFERATTVAYRDRKHVLISGTASIDARGHILHPGDVSRQLSRALQNIEALLNEADAGGADLCMLIAYLRDPSDESVVRRGVRERFGNVPLSVVTGAICRPGWLVEVEGQAIISACNSKLPPL